MDTDHTLTHFGEQLKIKREMMGLSLEMVSGQLKLSTRVLAELEQSSSSDLPSSFIIGYLKSYARFLQFSDQDIQRFLEHVPIQSIQNKHLSRLTSPIKLHTKNPNSHKIIMRMFTTLLSVTLIALSAAWWYNQAGTSTEEMIPGIKSEQHEVAHNQARVFLHVLNTLQNPITNFTSIPPTPFNTEKTVALKKNPPLSHPDDDDEEDDDEEIGTARNE